MVRKIKVIEIEDKIIIPKISIKEKSNTKRKTKIIEEIITKIEEKPKRKRSTKAERAEKAENKAKITEHTTQEKFTAEINGVECEGVMVKFDDRSIYLCQNFIVGGFISRKLRQGYKFSIFVGYGEITSPLVKNLKIIENF